MLYFGSAFFQEFRSLLLRNSKALYAFKQTASMCFVPADVLVERDSKIFGTSDSVQCVVMQCVLVRQDFSDLGLLEMVNCMCMCVYSGGSSRI